MGLAILGVTGFQVYWLKQNYTREKKSLEIKTDLAFRETILQLQASKLDLETVYWNEKSGKPAVKLIVGDGDKKINGRVSPKREIISTVNIIRDKLKDSLKKEIPGKVIISMDHATVNIQRDTGLAGQEQPGLHPGKDYIFRLLSGVDSLQDSLRLSEIDSAFTQRLSRDNIRVPYSITRQDSAEVSDSPTPKKVMVGFTRPVTYNLNLGNTFPYLLREIAQPIGFSILLLGITILSFVLLYRSLLKQQRLSELKNEFISNITHELKTPIATVGVAIEALKNFNAMDDPARTREYLDISGNEIQRLGLLVDKVLKLSMFEKKEIELKYELVNLHDLVREVTDSMKLQLEKHHARVSVTQEGGVNLQGDRLHLLSVVFNLLDNALKYGKEDPEILIQVTGNEEQVELRVTDNGIGIPPGYRDRIFEKFFRVPHGDTHNAKGYGLGLSYAAQVIKKHKGTMRVESEQGQGTSFIITIPKNMTP